MRTSFFVSIAVVASAVALAACSKHAADSSGDAGAAASALSEVAQGAQGAVALPGIVPAKYAHPCQILTKADAESVLGAKPLQEKETTQTINNGMPSDVGCVWSIAGGGGFAELHIHMPTKKDRFDHVNPFTPKRAVVGNVGDKAFLETETKWGHVDVLKGDQTFFVQVENGNVVAGHGKEAIEKMHEETVSLARTLANKM